MLSDFEVEAYYAEHKIIQNQAGKCTAISVVKPY